MERGRFIVIEGIGGAGKTTQVSRLKARLEELGEEVVVTREPCGDQTSEEVRSFIFRLKEKGILKPEHQVALFFFARERWMKNVVIPALLAGKTILTDRTYISTAAYQGYGEGADLDSIREFTDEIMGGNKPDLVILLDLATEEALRRLQNAKDDDPFDSGQKGFFDR